jgi:hypothetical protein
MWVIAAGAGLLIPLVVCFVGWRATRALRLSTAEVHSERVIPFDVHPFAAPVGVGFELVGAPAVFPQAARFSRDDSYMLSSVAADLSITELVDCNKGVRLTNPDLPSHAINQFLGIVADPGLEHRFDVLNFFNVL